MKTVTIQVCDFTTKSKTAKKTVNKESVQKVLASEDFNLKLKRGAVTGLFAHKYRYEMNATSSPKWDHTPQEDEIALSKYLANSCTKMWIEGDVLLAELALTDNEYGNIMASFYEAKREVPVSMAVNADVGKDEYYILDIYGVDFTFRPDLNSKVVSINFSEGGDTTGEFEDGYNEDTIVDGKLVAFSCESKIMEGTKKELCFSAPTKDAIEARFSKKVNNYNFSYEDTKSVIAIKKFFSDNGIVESIEDVTNEYTKEEDFSEEGCPFCKAVSELGYECSGSDIDGAYTLHISKDGEDVADIVVEEGDTPESIAKAISSESRYFSDNNVSISYKKDGESYEEIIPVAQLDKYLEMYEVDSISTFSETTVLNNQKVNFSLEQYIRENTYKPWQVLRNRINEVIRVCSNRKQDWISSNIKFIKYYIDAYVLDWFKELLKNPGQMINIMMGLRLDQYMDVGVIRDLQRILQRVRDELNRVGTMNIQMQKDFNKAYNTMQSHLHLYISNKLADNGKRFE